MTRGYRGYGVRVHDAATADAMLGAVLELGHDQLDTCSVYRNGSCEQMLGDLRAAERFGIATRGRNGHRISRRFRSWSEVSYANTDEAPRRYKDDLPNNGDAE
jgi:aryl-alcohol dehydrogenase-like predicted oxidoreductase